MLKNNAEADPWKVIVGFIIVIVCMILILFFFTDTFKTGSKNFSFECWELEIPGKCFCDNPSDCATEEGRNECKDKLRDRCK